MTTKTATMEPCEPPLRRLNICYHIDQVNHHSDMSSFILTLYDHCDMSVFILACQPPFWHISHHSNMSVNFLTCHHHSDMSVNFDMSQPFRHVSHHSDMLVNFWHTSLHSDMSPPFWHVSPILTCQPPFLHVSLHSDTFFPEEQGFTRKMNNAITQTWVILWQ